MAFAGHDSTIVKQVAEAMAVGRSTGDEKRGQYSTPKKETVKSEDARGDFGSCCCSSLADGWETDALPTSLNAVDITSGSASPSSYCVAVSVSCTGRLLDACCAMSIDNHSEGNLCEPGTGVHTTAGTGVTMLSGASQRA